MMKEDNGVFQLNMFIDYEALERDRRLQGAMLEVKRNSDLMHCSRNESLGWRHNTGKESADRRSRRFKSLPADAGGNHNEQHRRHGDAADFRYRDVFLKGQAGTRPLRSVSASDTQAWMSDGEPRSFLRSMH